MTSRRVNRLCLLLSILVPVFGHDHHPGDVESVENLEKPIDTILWLHIIIQVVIWGFMFPIGMVLGIAR